MAMLFSSFDDVLDAISAPPEPDKGACDGARARNAVLTKPPGALGRLEEIAIWYAGWRATPRPVLFSPQVVVFAGNHGVVAQGVSAFPADVTGQMVANFEAGGAAINQLARDAGARLDVVPLDLETSTTDFTRAPAMTERACAAAFSAGWSSLREGTDLLVVGEMGIGNTTSAAALAMALVGGGAADWVGRGTGVDDAGLERKTAAVAAGAGRHAGLEPLHTLAALGGREIAAMTGAMAAARMARVPVILDGFIATSAAAVLHALAPALVDHVIAGHRSAENAHARLLEHLGQVPLLDLGMRLGEGSGAALAIHVVRAALSCHSGMATFEEAAISTA